MIEYIIAGAGIAIAGHYFKKAQPQIKGYLGEVKLAHAMKHLGIPGKVKIMRDSLFYAERGGTSQVDVLAVTRFGIIILENKNYRSDVYGDLNKEYWDCMYPRREDSVPDPFDYLNKKNRYKKSEPLYNPVWQNKSHISAVSAVLREKYPHIPYYSLAVFSDSTRLFVQNSRNKVCNLKQLGKVIPRIVGEEVLTDKQVDEIAGILEKKQIRGRQARKVHVATVQLGREVHDQYTNKDLEVVEKQYRRMAEGKPVWSAEGDKTPPEKNMPNSYGGRPLNEIIQTAQSRAGDQGQSQRATHGKQFSR